MMIIIWLKHVTITTEFSNLMVMCKEYMYVAAETQN
jgi:hypothetical protein